MQQSKTPTNTVNNPMVPGMYRGGAKRLLQLFKDHCYGFSYQGELLRNRFGPVVLDTIILQDVKFMCDFKPRKFLEKLYAVGLFLSLTGGQPTRQDVWQP